MSSSRRIIIASLAVMSACWGEQASDADVVLVPANKSAYGVVERAGVIAFLDGAEASSDPSTVGIDVRVVDRSGVVTTVGPTSPAIRAAVLLDDAVATLELVPSG